MLTVFINVVLMLVAFALGYALQPKISRKLSYRKRGQAAKKRAYVKKAAKVGTTTVPTSEAGARGNKLNGSADLKVQTPQGAVSAGSSQELNGGGYSR